MFCGVSVAALLAATGATAQERTFDVPAGLAANSIPQFARQAGVQIIAPAGKLKGVVTPAVKGRQDVSRGPADLPGATISRSPPTTAR
jgi:hypothetical protein